MRKLLIVLMSIFFSLGSINAFAVPFGFDNITNNNAGDAAIGEAQLFVDVTDPGSGQVLFTFFNTGPAASSVADVYFDDGSLLGIASINNGPGVSFSQGATPPNLPGGNNATPPFQTTFSADSDAPAQPNGVNPGESLGLLFNLQTGNTFADVLVDLGDGSLRLGIHVQGFATGGSESFVNNPNQNNPNPVPEPATLFLLGSGLLGLAGLRKKLKR